MPDWRSFQDLRLPAAAGGFAAPALSATDCPTACQDRILFQADAASQTRETALRATGNNSSGILLRRSDPLNLARLRGGEPAHACSPNVAGSRAIDKALGAVWLWPRPGARGFP